MVRTILSIALILAVTPSFAQQTPAEQALGSKLMEEIRSNVALRAQLIQAQEQIKALEAKVPKEDPNAKRK